ncbi:hypothetical protein FRC12_012691 [Ceratobasidium sp. 428]|nr:hypothetical protein FRC12_012691 [Ceratobasidium sp. 428]
MAQRANYYAHEEYEEDLGDVNIEAVVGNYGQGGHGIYNEDQARIDEATMSAMQHQMAQQAAFAQIPDVVKRVSELSQAGGSLINRVVVYCSIPSSDYG